MTEAMLNRFDDEEIMSLATVAEITALPVEVMRRIIEKLASDHRFRVITPAGHDLSANPHHIFVRKTTKRDHAYRWQQSLCECASRRSTVCPQHP